MFTATLQSFKHCSPSHKRTVRLGVPETGHSREQQPKPCSELSNFTAIKGFLGIIYIAPQKYETIPSGQMVGRNKMLSSIQRQWLLPPALPRKQFSSIQRMILTRAIAQKYFWAFPQKCLAHWGMCHAGSHYAGS